MKEAAAVLVLALGAAACDPAAKEAPPAEREGKTPTRIVALTCGAVDILTALGELGRVVAVEEDCPAPGTETMVKIRNDDHPGQTRIVNVESVLALRPDLVIAKEELKPALGSRGVPVLWSPDAVNLANLPAFTAAVAEAVGAGEKGRALVEGMRAKERALRERTAPLPKVRVYYEYVGLGGTVGSASVIDEMIRLAGGANVAGGEPKPSVRMTAEAILAADPEVVILGPFAEATEAVLARPGWDRMSAVRNGRVHRVPLERRYVVLGTPRCVDGCGEMFLPWIHPEAAASGGKR